MKPEQTTLITEPEWIAAPGPSAAWEAIVGIRRRDACCLHRHLICSLPSLKCASPPRFDKAQAASMDTVQGGTS